MALPHLVSSLEVVVVGLHCHHYGMLGLVVEVVEEGQLVDPN